MEIVPSLTLIFNSSLATGIFPDGWKVATVSAIYKSGDKLDWGNYRPISVLPAVAKPFEKLVLKNQFLKTSLALENITQQ